MKIFSCDHSLLGDCFICQLKRGEISDPKIYFGAAFLVGLLLGFFGFLKF